MANVERPGRLRNSVADAPARRPGRGGARHRSPGPHAACPAGPGCRWPCPRSCRSRRESPCDPLSGEAEVWSGPGLREKHPAVPFAPATGTGVPRMWFPRAPGQGGGRHPAQGGGGTPMTDRSRSRTSTFGSVRLWLVMTVDGDPLVGQPAHDGPEAEQPPGMAHRLPAVDGHDLDAQAVRDARLEGGGHGRVVDHRRRASRVAAPCRRTGPAPNGRGRTAVVAIEPAPPDAVTTEVNGMTARAVGDVDALLLRVRAAEAVAVGDRPARLLDRTGRRCGRARADRRSAAGAGWPAARGRPPRRPCRARGSWCSSSASRARA